MTYITYITYMTYMTYITYIIYITYVTDSTYSTYMTYRTYSTYITDITYTLHDFTAHSDLWQLRAWEGKGTEEKKKQSCSHSCCQRSLTPIQAHALPSACRAESYLLCCQPEPSLSRYLSDYHELLHGSLADCKLKGDELCK